MELISVIVPVYNIEKYLPRCLDSILRQSYQNLEILLVDDGSADGTVDICKRYMAQDPRVSLIVNAGKGVSSARNVGVRSSHGAYIVMVDSDDYIAPDMIEVLHCALVENHADMSVCDFVRGKEEQYTFDPFFGDIQTVSADEVLRRIYLNDHNKLRYVVPWIKLYKRELFEDIQYPEGKIFEDIYTTHKLIAKCQTIAVVDGIMSYYYQRSDSIMNHAFHLKKLDYLGALEERIVFLRERNLLDLERKQYDELLHALIWEYSRVRDILHDKEAQNSIHAMFKKYYKRNHESSCPSDTKFLRWLFYVNPELVILYWKISGKLQEIKKKCLK